MHLNQIKPKLVWSWVGTYRTQHPKHFGHPQWLCGSLFCGRSFAVHGCSGYHYGFEILRTLANVVPFLSTMKTLFSSWGAIVNGVIREWHLLYLLHCLAWHLIDRSSHRKRVMGFLLINWTKTWSKLYGDTRTKVTFWRLPLEESLPLLFHQLTTFVVNDYCFVHHVLECRECMQHQLVLQLFVESFQE